MPDSTNQSPQDAFISSNGTDPEQWRPENNTNFQNVQGLEWNAVPNQHMVPVSSNVNQNFVSNGNELIRFNAPPNYINVQYPRPANMQNNFPGNLPRPQMPQMPVIVRPPHGPSSHPQTWASQQNLKLIQTAWNKTSSGIAKKQKRVRTAFTSHQMMELEQEYARTRYLDRTRRIEMAELLRLNERTIKIWFQNRRMKEKKDRIENTEEVEHVSTTQPPPELGVPMDQDQYMPNGEGFNRMGVFVEQYPVSTTSVPLPQAQMVALAPTGFSSYAVPVGCPPQYQSVHLQVQYPSSYSEVQELSPESAAQSESSVSVENNTQSDTTENNWDMAWIRSIKAEDEC